jgi:hypothetical protein
MSLGTDVGRDDDVPVGAVSRQRRSAGDIASWSILVVCSDDAVWPRLLVHYAASAIARS